MHSARRVALLRLVALIAVGVSAALVADDLHPGRGICPLAAACDAAAASALGNIFGVPTSWLGVGAFSLFFLVTLLPLEWARQLLQVAGGLAMTAGAAFIAYQALALRTFCPLCLVADTAGILAGLIALTWPPLPIRFSGRRLEQEAVAPRVVWSLVAVLVLAGAFLWPRPQEQGWTELPEDLVLTADLLGEAEPPAAPTPPPFPEPAVAAPEDAAPSPAPAPPLFPAPAPARPRATFPPPTGRSTARAPAGRIVLEVAPGAAEAVAAPPEEAPAPRAQTEPAEPPPAAPTPKPPEAPAEPPVVMVEYLNAFCAHCRATHARLARVLASTDVPVRRHVVWTWAGDTVPAWARACDHAADLGRGEAMFEALLSARRDNRREIEAAARRAGVDIAGLRQALARRDITPRLARHRDVARRARLQGLPTFDVGRRRLMGEQSEAELRRAILAAEAARERAR